MNDMTQLILKKLDDLERKMDHMMSNGCAKVMSHAEVVENQREIFSRHIFKNAIIPIAQGIPASLAACITGAIITESMP